jgi:hypothetical protein
MFLIFVSVLAGLNLGSIRKVEDPIRDTQTDPILYEQKKEEEKDGKKGPLLYNVKNNPRESFFIDSPLAKAKKNPSQEIAPEKALSPAGTADWWEEQSTEPQTTPPRVKASEPVPEPLPETEKKVFGDKPEEPPVAAPEAEDTASGKGDNYWW